MCLQEKGVRRDPWPLEIGVLEIYALPARQLGPYVSPSLSRLQSIAPGFQTPAMSYAPRHTLNGLLRVP